MSAAHHLAAKLVILYLLPGRLRHGFPAPFLAWVGPINTDVFQPLWSPCLLVLFLSGAFLTGCNRAPRVGAAVCGGVLFLHLLASPVHYSNSMLFFASLLCLLAAETPATGSWLIRAQLALVYFGAGLNKLLDPDWRDGQFIDYWSRSLLQLDWYAEAAGWFAAGRFAAAVSWLVICVELVLAALVVRPSLTRLAMLSAVVFHGGMIVYSAGAISWIFFVAMIVGFLSLAGDGRMPALLRPGAWLAGTIIFFMAQRVGRP